MAIYEPLGKEGSLHRKQLGDLLVIAHGFDFGCVVGPNTVSLRTVDVSEPQRVDLEYPNTGFLEEQDAIGGRSSAIRKPDCDLRIGTETRSGERSAPEWGPSQFTRIDKQ